MKLTKAQYSQLAPYWDLVEQEFAEFNANALFARYEDCFVSRLPNNTPVAAVFCTRRLVDPFTRLPTVWIWQWVTNKNQTAIVQARHVARAMAEGAQFYIPLGYTVAYGIAPDLNGRGVRWARQLIAANVVDVMPLPVGEGYRINLANYLTEMQARS